MEAIRALFASKAKEFFPEPSAQDVRLFEALPEEFCLDVPYLRQESRWGSGSACLQMLASFHGLDASKSLSTFSKLESSWKSFNHETLAEDLARSALDMGLLPFEYYPGRFVLPQFDEGYKGADFIAQNFGIISPFDRVLMKAAIFGTRSPLFARVHFATDEYKMSEPMATVLDTAGHGLLLCGWNAEGFIVHDPWNSKWGGYGGGEYRVLSYRRLSEQKPLVNCCAEGSHAFLPIDGFIRHWGQSVFPGREMQIEFELTRPRLPSYYFNYLEWDYELELSVARSLSIVGASTVEMRYQNLLKAGDDDPRVAWSVNTGDRTGSHAMAVRARAKGIYPVFPWEARRNKPKKIECERVFQARLDVKSLDWLNQYARFNKDR